MAEPTPSSPSPTPTPAHEMPRVIVRSYPKVIFFWLTWLMSLVAGVIGGGQHLGTVWMCVFAFNLLVISFDFNEVVSVMLLAIVAAILIAGLHWGFLGFVGDWFRDLQLAMSRSFYFTMFGLFTIFFAVVFVKTRFDYWEFRYNEVIHRRGMFADIKRYSTEDLRWFKEIPDVLERILAGSGRMILTTPRESAPIVIEHVLRIGSIDEQVADILGTKRVVIT